MNLPNSSRRLLDANQLAALFGCSVDQVHNLDASRICPRHVRLGGLKRWDREVIERWLEGGCPDLRFSGSTEVTHD